MTEQQEIQVKKIFMKHCKNVHGFLTVDSNVYEGQIESDFDILVEQVIHTLVPKIKKDDFENMV